MRLKTIMNSQFRLELPLLMFRVCRTTSKSIGDMNLKMLQISRVIESIGVRGVQIPHLQEYLNAVEILVLLSPTALMIQLHSEALLIFIM